MSLFVYEFLCTAYLVCGRTFNSIFFFHFFQSFVKLQPTDFDEFGLYRRVLIENFRKFKFPTFLRYMVGVGTPQTGFFFLEKADFLEATFPNRPSNVHSIRNT